MAKGLDCGTSYYITATENSIKKQRNVFLTVDGDANQVKRMLKDKEYHLLKKQVKFISLDNTLLIMLKYLVRQN